MYDMVREGLTCGLAIPANFDLTDPHIVLLVVFVCSSPIDI